MENILDQNQLVDNRYEVKFFVEGTDCYQKYRVIDNNGKTLLLKIYNSSKLSKYSFLDDGLLEAEILSSLNANNIIKLVGNGELVSSVSKYHYLVFDFISGETLQEKLEREGAFSQYAAIPLVIDVARALSSLHAHPKTIIHNNINPNSITLDYSDNKGAPVLTNFNFSRYISSKSNSIDVTQLSPCYIAPELYNGIFTPQSDVFSVGALLYHLIFGIPPWHSEIPRFQHTHDKYLAEINENRCKPLNFRLNSTDELSDDHLKETIKRALAIDVDERFSSASELIEHLTREKVLEQKNIQIDAPIRVAAKAGQGFSAIAGMQHLKDILYNDVIRALNEQELYQTYGVTIPNGMLLYGPPGCGKTFISERFSEEVGFNIIELKPSDIKSKWLNETEQKIGAIFREAAENAPTIIFIDEFDAIVPSRESDLNQSTASSVNEILAQMSNCSERGIFVIAASNRPEKIDPAVLRTGRIDRIIYLPPPDDDARASMFELYLKDRPVDLGVDYRELSRLTNNYVSSDIKFLIDEASRTALKTKERITQEILEHVIENTQPSISRTEIRKYELLKDQFENKSTSRPKKNPIGFFYDKD